MPSSIGPLTKMMRSRSSREKMSKARSPRLDCSITIGTRLLDMGFSSGGKGGGRRVRGDGRRAGALRSKRHAAARDAGHTEHRQGRADKSAMDDGQAGAAGFG